MDLIVPLFWLVLAIVFLLIEASTFNLFTVWFALGAVVALFVSFLTDSYVVQIIVFLAVSVISMFTIRNYAVKKFRAQTIKTNVNSLVGKKAKVTRKIEPYKYGEVKVDGNYWTAKPENDETIEQDSIVEIIEVSGVKLIVKKIS